MGAHDEDGAAPSRGAEQGAGRRSPPQAAAEALDAVSLSLRVPAGAAEGQALAFVDSTGRSMQARVPKDKKEGDVFEVTLPGAVRLTVPEGCSAGDVVVFQAPGGGAKMQALVPEGKTAGDTFEVQLAAAPPTHVSLTIPEGVEAGALIGFTTPGGERMKAVVPHGKKAGESFQVQLQPPRATTWKVLVPEHRKPGDPVTFMGPNGQQVTVNVPQPKSEKEDPLKAGDTFAVNLPTVLPQGRMQSMTVVVPEGSKPGSSISFKGSDGNLIWAQVPPGLQEGEKFNVQFLVRDGPQTPEQAQLGQLCNAASGEDLEAVKRFLAEGVPVNGVYDLGFTALTYAAMNGRTEIVKYLLAEKADIAAKTHDVRTPLHFACRNGHTETAKELLAAEAPSDVKDVLGRTPLKTAEEKGQVETVEALKAMGILE